MDCLPFQLNDVVFMENIDLNTGEIKKQPYCMTAADFLWPDLFAPIPITFEILQSTQNNGANIVSKSVSYKIGTVLWLEVSNVIGQGSWNVRLIKEIPRKDDSIDIRLYNVSYLHEFQQLYRGMAQKELKVNI